MSTITTRAGKGSPLTNTEVDSNFTNLNDDKIENVVEDTSPQLGGNLDLNSNNITGTGNIDVTGTVTADGVILDQTTNSISAATSDGSDNARIFLNGGGAPSINRGGNISVYGNEYATSGGNIALIAGNAETGGAVQGHIKMLTGNARERLTIEDNGDISFYDTSGLSQPFFWDASAERLGIGTTSPSAPLDVVSAGGLPIIATSTSSKASIAFEASGTTYRPFIGADGDNLHFSTGLAYEERMRITSSGDMLVGTTDVDLGYTNGDTGLVSNPAGFLQIARDSSQGYPLLYLNRLNHDGKHIEFWKDGATVGSIGANGGALTLGNDDAALRFSGASNGVFPFNVTTQSATNGVLSLGGAGAQFKDIHLSGNANVNTVDFGDWTITESGGALYFATGGTNKMKLNADGSLDVAGDINANATIS